MEKHLFGYKFPPDTTHSFIIDEEVAPIVRRIFNEAKSGKSCRAIATDLSIDGIATPSQYAVSKGCKMTKVATHWSDPRIREILLNEVYIGNMVQGRMKKINYKSKINFRLPKDQWKIVKGTHEPIIDESTFIKAKEMIETRKQTRVKSHDYLLKGLIYCHECGKKMGCSPRQLAEGKVYYLRCSTYTSFARLNLCTSHCIREDFVEKQVIKKITEICKKFVNKDNLIDVTKLKIEEKSKSVSYLKETENLKKELEKITFEIDSIYSDKLNGILSEDDFKRIYERKKQEKKTILEKQEKINNYIKNDIIDETEVSLKIVQKFLDTIQNTSTSNITREILTDLVDKIEIDNNKNIYIHCKFKSFENL